MGGELAVGGPDGDVTCGALHYVTLPGNWLLLSRSGREWGRGEKGYEHSSYLLEILLVNCFFS